MVYLPYSQRSASGAYQQVLAAILAHGVRVPTRQGPAALTLMQQTLTYPLEQGFPLITDRKIAFWPKAIAELCAFINGATTVEQFEQFGCDWWGAWATPEKTVKKGIEPGTLGPGSYGGAFAHFPTAEDPRGPGFDQFAHLVEQIRELPELRTHFVSPWIPQYQGRGQGKTPRTTIAPCHGWVHVRVLEGKLHLHMFQRSADVPVGVPSNMVQYAALLLMLEQLTGYPAATYYHTMSDAHIYEDQIEAVTTLLQREPRRLPTMQLTPEGREISDIHDFRAEHFVLSDYDPHPGIRNIPVAV